MGVPINVVSEVKIATAIKVCLQTIQFRSHTHLKKDICAHICRHKQYLIFSVNKPRTADFTEPAVLQLQH